MKSWLWLLCRKVTLLEKVVMWMGVGITGLRKGFVVGLS